MGKLVVLRLDGDSQQQGYRVNLAIGEDNSRPSIEITGRLPPAPELATYLQLHWLGKYRSLAAPYRLERISVHYGGSLNQRITECQESAQTLRKQLTLWLNSELFLPVDRRLREELNRDDMIRFLICTDDASLHKLPWQEWDFFQRYPKAEIALGATQFERSRKPQTVIVKNKIKILAILGNSQGIDIAVDRRRLEALPDAEVEFLVEPERQQLNDRLWDQPWDILYFAGHSETQGETGRIYINQVDSLSIHELKHGLRKAIAQGLQLAIFNSCDGLGLAYELEQLHIPQIIVMREPVPDKIAQEFLQHLLRAFAAGDSLYLAERQARERLQGWEHQFPCASWLPVIYQNPIETPPDWLKLRGQIEGQTTSSLLGGINDTGRQEQEDKANSLISLSPHLPTTSLTTPASTPKDTQPALLKRLRLATVLLASVTVTSLVMGARYIGILEPLELGAYDHLIRQRQSELIDQRILVVEITQADIAKHQYPLDDAIVAQLLEKLEQSKPRALGLDMHRSRSRGVGRADFLRRFQQNQNFFLVCASGSSDPNYAPPPEFSPQQLSNQVGFSDLVVDGFNLKDRSIRADLVVGEHEDTSRIVRRQLLSYDPSLSSSPSDCSTPYSFSFQLAFQFLHKAGIQPMEVNSNEEWQFGTVAFKRLAARFGGYQHLDGQSSQIMVNYRANQPGQRVTLQQVLAGQVDRSWVNDRIVLVGYTAPIARDNFETPDGQMAGIWVHAHMVSQILSAVMEERSLIWGLPQWGSIQWGDTLWVFAWSITGGLLAWGLQGRSRLYLGLAVSATTLALYQICLVILMQGGWVPLIPSVLALLATGSILVIYQTSHRH